MPSIQSIADRIAAGCELNPEEKSCIEILESLDVDEANWSEFEFLLQQVLADKLPHPWVSQVTNTRLQQRTVHAVWDRPLQLLLRRSMRTGFCSTLIPNTGSLRTSTPSYTKFVRGKASPADTLSLARTQNLNQRHSLCSRIIGSLFMTVRPSSIAEGSDSIGCNSMKWEGSLSKNNNRP